MARKAKPAADAKATYDMNVEAIRAGFFTMGLDLVNDMKEHDVPDAAAALIDGSIAYVTELYWNTMIEAGYSPARVRAALLDNIKKGMNAAKAKRERAMN